MNNLQDLLEEIKRLERELLLEIQKKEDEFCYKIKGRKVFFEEKIKKQHKVLASKISTYIFDASVLNIFTVPIIWFCLFPAVFLDLVATLYQFSCFKIYGIPRVTRSTYMVIDRQSLNYLNVIEKLNCVYCGYFNGVLAYVQEIAARTEQYWCPIKHARKVAAIHSRYHKFLEYGDGKEFKSRLAEIRKDFGDLKGVE